MSSKNVVAYYIDDVRCGICGANRPRDFVWTPAGAACLPCLRSKATICEPELNLVPRRQPQGVAA